MKTNRKGRPTKRTPRLESSLLKSIEDGLPLSHAAAVAGISYETFCEWRRQFPDFSDAISKAVARGILFRLKVIKRAAARGDVRAACWYLEHIHPTHYAKSRVDVLHTLASEAALVTSNGKLNIGVAMEEVSPTALRSILESILSGRGTKFAGQFAPPAIDLPPPAPEDSFPNRKRQIFLESNE